MRITICLRATCTGILALPRRRYIVAVLLVVVVVALRYVDLTGLMALLGQLHR